MLHQWDGRGVATPCDVRSTAVHGDGPYIIVVRVSFVLMTPFASANMGCEKCTVRGVSSVSWDKHALYCC